MGCGGSGGGGALVDHLFHFKRRLFVVVLSG